MVARRNVLKLAAGVAVVGSVAGALEVMAEVRGVAQAAAPVTDRIALKGYDPVAYFTLKTPTPGVAEYDYVYDGARYYFATARHRDLFKANPEKYAPQFGGNCANNMSNGQRRESDPTVWVIIGDKLYVFAGAAGADRFRQDAQTAALKAAANWKMLKATSNQ